MIKSAYTRLFRDWLIFDLEHRRTTTEFDKRIHFNIISNFLFSCCKIQNISVEVSLFLVIIIFCHISCGGDAQSSSGAMWWGEYHDTDSVLLLLPSFFFSMCSSYSQVFVCTSVLNNTRVEGFRVIHLLFSFTNSDKEQSRTQNFH